MGSKILRMSDPLVGFRALTDPDQETVDKIAKVLIYFIFVSFSCKKNQFVTFQS